MKKNLMKVLLTTVSCATLAIGGASMTADAYVHPDFCDHSDYIVDCEWTNIVDWNDGGRHEYITYQEIFCWKCGKYDTIQVNTETEWHIKGDDGKCVICHGDISF